MSRLSLQRLRGDQSASAAVEFALIGPVFITMLLAVLQFGITMRDYNALRSASGDVARYAIVNYETANRLTDEQLSSYARSVAIRSPYGLSNDRVTATVTTPGKQRIAGAVEKQIAMTYEVDLLVGMIDLPTIRLRFSRPVFLLEN